MFGGSAQLKAASTHFSVQTLQKLFYLYRGLNDHGSFCDLLRPQFSDDDGREKCVNALSGRSMRLELPCPLLLLLASC